MKQTYICSYSRTPIGAYQGSLSSVSATKLGAISIGATVGSLSLNRDLVNEVIMGNVLSANLGQAPARQACLGAGLPNSVECLTINKVCGSGLKSVMLADQSIKTSNSDVVIAGGMENMSLSPHYVSQSRKGTAFGHNKIIDSIIYDGLSDPYNNMLMGDCAEILCDEKSYSREEQDNYAIESYKRANKAISNGFFSNEITPVKIKNKKGAEIIVSKDEEPLKFNQDKILQLRPVFKKNGSITAANASSLSDGAASVSVVSENMVKKYNLKPAVKIIAHCSKAIDPLYFTKAPIYAIKGVLEIANKNAAEIDLYEINEAFSCVPLVAMEELGLDYSKVNIHGGAVALGHPIGCSGTRILVTLINALKIKKLKYGIASLCIGGGEAAAILVENCNEDE